ncbi:MAG: ketopantoate reductase family protein [Gammaproteobacteria bacterium]|nr:ketopantoate reductase family protein [Gammaproteobacteria bacterium]
MKITVIGAGAMGGTYGGLLARAGHEVALVDTWAEHVQAINADGLRVSGACGEHVIPIEAMTEPRAEWADLAIFFVDTNANREAAPSVPQALNKDGFAITFQNGIGNVEALQSVLSAERVLGGSSMCSAASVGPGHVNLTHMGTTSLGEVHATTSARADGLADALTEAGLPAEVKPDIMAEVWQKFILNVAINAICATSGLRPAEVARLKELDQFQDRIIDEALAVTAAKGVQLPNPNLREVIKGQGVKLNRPSMLQHVEAGRQTEIDAINGALIREAKALGVPTPYNEALTALLKGREQKQRRLREEPNLDYDAWQARIDAGDT